MTQLDTLNDLLDARYSCRAFKSDPIPQNVVEQIIATACKAPSWCNAQPWQVTVTSPSATAAFKDALLGHIGKGPAQMDLPAPEGYPDVYGDRRRTCGWQLYDAVGVTKGDRAGSATQMMRNFSFFDAPHVAILTSPRVLGGYGALDSGGFLMAFLLAAKALGIDTIPQAAIANYSEFVRDYFDIPQDRMMLCAISFGYGDPTHPANSFRTERAAIADVLEWKE